MDLASLLMDAGYACIPLGLAVVGERRKLGWTIGLLGQTLMVGYGLASAHLWMIAMPSICAAIQTRHLIIWRHESWCRLNPPSAPASDPSRERLITPKEAEELLICQANRKTYLRRLHRGSVLRLRSRSELHSQRY